MNRISHYSKNGKDYVICFGPIVARTIETGNIMVLETTNLLASSEYPEYRFNIFFGTRFRHADKNKKWTFEGEKYNFPFTCTVDHCRQHMPYTGYKENSKMIQHMKKILKNSNDVEIMLVTKRLEGKKISGKSLIHFVPTDGYISRTIDNNKLARRAREKRVIIDHEKQTYLVEPIQSESDSSASHKKAKHEYGQKKIQEKVKGLNLGKKSSS